ncbi:hypothetical protein RPC_4214 [Rhodopseudomonas palustris BisB18]|uniref:Uncharacterized protein n=2 Tax=Rhodopseudomonas palustris TaxID=1076 RepID=Q20YP8_RHOPB
MNGLAAYHFGSSDISFPTHFYALFIAGQSMPSRVIMALVLTLVAAAIILLANVVLDISQKTQLQIAIEANVANQSTLAIFVDDEPRPYLAQRARFDPHLYIAPGVQQGLHRMRLELSGLGEGDWIRAVTFEVGDTPIRRFDVEQIRAAGPTQIGRPAIVDRQTVLTPVDGKLSIALADLKLSYNGPSIARLPQWTGRLGRGDGVLGLILLGFVLVVIANARGAGMASVLVLCLTSTVSVYLAVPIITAMVAVPDAASLSVGRAAYFGLSTLANQLAVLIALAGAATAAVCLLIIRRGQSACVGPAVAPGAATLAGRWRGAVALVLTVFVASVPLLAVAPDIYAQGHYPIPPGWDTNNITLWQYLIHEGFRPLRDFWFPYGGTWVFSLPAPWGQIFSAAEQTLLYAVLLLSLHVVMGRRLLAPFAIVSLIMIADRLYIFWGVFRYLLAVDVFIAFLAQLAPARTLWTRGLFPAAVLLAAFIEPIQLLYAAPAVLMTFCLAIRSQPGRSPHAVARRFALEFIPGFVAVAGYAAVLAATGDLKYQIGFLTSLGPHTVSSAVPTNLVAALGLRSDLAAIVALTGPCLLVAIGLYRCLATPKSAIRDMLLLGLGLIGFMFVQKYIVRENQWQCVLPTVLGLLVWAHLEPALQRLRTAAIAGLIAGLLVIVLRPTGEPSNYLQRLPTAPLKAARTLATAIRDTEQTTRTRQFAYSEQRFALYRPELELVRRLDALSSGAPGPVYVLGDTPQLYILLKQLPPYQSNNYNAAPIGEQRHVLAWLDDNKPRYVVWRIEDLQFELPHVLRVPLIYSRIVRDYVPLETVGGFAVLRQRGVDEKPALAWWRQHLTPVFDMGHILQNISTSRRPSCDPQDLSRCTPVLVLSVAEAQRRAPAISVPLASGDLEFELKFAPEPTVANYVVPLERLWAYDAATLLGQPLTIAKKDIPGVTVTREGRLRDERFLY